LGCGFSAAFLDFAAGADAHGVGVDDQVRDDADGRWQRVRADIRTPLPLESGNSSCSDGSAVLEQSARAGTVLREALPGF